MANLDLNNCATLPAEAGKYHGDICPDIQGGTRMTMCGLRKLGITDPMGTDRPKLMVFVEIETSGQSLCRPCHDKADYDRILISPEQL
jgi:formylmethanofuran dehydrogenase subunit E